MLEISLHCFGNNTEPRIYNGYSHRDDCHMHLTLPGCHFVWGSLRKILLLRCMWESYVMSFVLCILAKPTFVKKNQTQNSFLAACYFIFIHTHTHIHFAFEDKAFSNAYTPHPICSDEHGDWITHISFKYLYTDFLQFKVVYNSNNKIHEPFKPTF